MNRGAKTITSKDVRENLICKLFRSSNGDKAPNAGILKILIEQGEEYPIYDQQSAWAFTKHVMDVIYRYDFIDFLEAMIDTGLDLVKAETISKGSLIKKSLEGHYDRVSKVTNKLLEIGCSIDPIEGDYGSPIGQAIEEEQYHFAIKLIKKGADIGQLGSFLFKVAEHHKMPNKLRDLLVQGQDLNKVNRYGETALNVAIEYGNTEFVTFLANNGVDINQDKEYGSALIYAVHRNNKPMINHLISLGADLNVLNKEGETALDIALSLAGFKRTCAMMVKAGAKTSIEMSGGEHDLESIVKSIKKAIQPGEKWASVAAETLSKLGVDKAIFWNSLIRHCLDNNSAKPSKKWFKEGNLLLEEIGVEEFKQNMLTWLPLVKQKRTGSLQDDNYYGDSTHIVSENNTRLLKGLIWLCHRIDTNEMSSTLRMLGTDMYKKVYGIGMRNAKLGNACLVSLSLMPGTVGLKEIIVMRSATKYNPALVNINRVFNKLAEASGKTPDELAELSIPCLLYTSPSPRDRG